jgi:peptide/nickel transport system permease protein
VAAAVSWAFRALLVLALPERARPGMRRAPLTAAFGMLVILIYAMAALFAPLIAPYGEAEIVGQAFAPPGDGMLLGGDQIGRDLFSRLIYGARNTVGLALAATIIAFVVGAAFGLLAAVKGGWLDQVLGRVVDVMMSVPSLILALLIMSITGTNLAILVVVVAAIYAPRVFRLTRAVAGGIVVMDYVEAARLRGEGDAYIIRREVLPNASAPLIAEFGLEFCFVFLLIAGLSFLGLGIQPPTADWGSMVRETATLISFGEVTPLIPAGAIALLTVAINFVVDWMLFRSSGLKER